ncbi:MAG TPA: C25 family cysteine peptidase [Flavisolibacter sp.]|jgi:hypothetical protein|nr:C25 family cysteine peptidase [Flavisolibacter sp.]
MRKIFFGLLVLVAFTAGAQQRFNNEWIDYAKTYYKFKVGSSGVYRIPATTLSAVGLGNASVEQFQLWRNGVQVPLYTSRQTGILGGADYIEFWGQMNDGKADREMYRDPAFHYNDKWSLLTDSATYFLTVNLTGGNLRLQPTANNVSGNTLPAEPYFMYTTGKWYRNQINRGLYNVVGSDHLFSSSYDRGEGWTSTDIPRDGSLTENLNNLFVAPTGPDATLKIAVTGNAYNFRRYTVTLNGDSLLGDLVPLMRESVKEAGFSANRIASGNAAIVIKNITDPCGTSSCPSDRMVVHKIEVTYPRQFNFGGATNFEFSLPSSSQGTYLEIAGFNHSNVAPVLYDLTNGKRYEAQISGSLVKVVLQASVTPRSLVMVSQAAANVTSIQSMQARNFINYNTAATQGDYLIISNSLLFSGANGTNPVEEYRAYRASANGGSYNAKIYLDDQLVDQFAFGIKKHPAGIRNFIMYARNRYPVAPKHVFIIGRGVHYMHQQAYESNSNPTIKSNLEKLNLVPTFGFPASDMLLGADLSNSRPLIPVGRLTAITPAEVATYLKKVKDYETAQRTPSPSIADKDWMKQVLHIIGAGDGFLDDILFQYMENYRNKIQDTLMGGKVTTFRKVSTNNVEQLDDDDLTRLINNGVSLITYYGHSSATTLEFNLDDPGNYNNPGKYPMFFALGCNAGNTFDYNEGRFSARSYLSDKYVLAPERGSINFLASTHFGIVHYLDIWNSRAYSNMSSTLYGGTIGEIMKKTMDDVYTFTTTEDFFARANAEESVLNGDPAVRLNYQPKTDYTITDDMITVSPSFVSVADQSFRVKVQVRNLGKATNRKIVIETKRQFPDGITEVIRRDTILGTRYMDSLTFNVGIDPIRDKGNNKIFVMVDADNAVDEMFETNNTGSREFVVFEEEARPIYPANMAIVTEPNVKFKVSSANPFSTPKQYRVEIDTTENFNSPAKVVLDKTAAGGLIEFDPGMTFKDSIVYYWRVAPISGTGDPSWNTSSFVYLSNHAPGFNQSHYFQHQKSESKDLALNQGSTWTYPPVKNNLFIQTAVFPTGANQAASFSVSVNGESYIRSICGQPNIIVNVFDPNTFKPWYNAASGPGQFGSDDICGSDRAWNFQFKIADSSKRRKLVEFLEMIPSGYIVVIRNTSVPDSINNSFVDQWKADTTRLGKNRSIYHHLVTQGFSELDSYNKPRAFIFTYRKDVRNAETPKWAFTEGIYDRISLSVDYFTSGTSGSLKSPVFGPAKTWKEFRWDGRSTDSTVGSDKTYINLIGVKRNGVTDTLVRDIDINQRVVNISSVNAEDYPYMQMFMHSMDSTYHTPYQLRYWRLTYDPLPEGLVAPNIYFQMKDTFDVGEPVDFRLAFKNISPASYMDSLNVKVTVADRNNIQRQISVPKIRPVASNDTAIVQFNIDTKQLVGTNSLFVDVNPENNPLEQYRFNNFVFRSFYVRGDTLNPLLDVTFDNVHILNRDIVSAKPDILIKIKDEAKWMLLNDTAVATVQVRFPSGATRTYRYNSDTLTFMPATGAPNESNTAAIRLRPYFAEDGDYELIVTGKDMSNNTAGSISYRVGFQVINKAMISNMLNYPNPFTTSTAFVFTLTGSEVPQNIRIQILTVTGKIVREITKEELGSLHIGRNITEFKWDGTDQYGQKLGNGVYLYRVITNQHGKSLDKYTSSGDATDKYFNKGYGKMYLMR